MVRNGLRAALIGYGGAFSMGRFHANLMAAVPGIDVVAAVDTDRKRTAAARKELPGIKTFNSVKKLLDWDEFDVAVNLLPHNVHASVTLECLKAGKHGIVEKPFTITIAEATELIETAKANDVVLSVHHNRRWDADFWTVKGLVDRGTIGEVFNVEMWMGGYGRPNPDWWRSDKVVSGGAFHDWGAHFIDWLLNVVDKRMISVFGFFHDLVWHDISIEDHCHAVVRFEDGVSADVQQSAIAMDGKPKWRVLGSHGAIVSEEDHFKVRSAVKGQPEEQDVAFESRPGPTFYENFVAHVDDRDGTPLLVTPESARRVIAVIELAEKSSSTHIAETVPYEFEA